MFKYYGLLLLLLVYNFTDFSVGSAWDVLLQTSYHKRSVFLAWICWTQDIDGHEYCGSNKVYYIIKPHLIITSNNQC